jgi:hypothetical protein
VAESDTVSQELEAIQKGFNVGPGLGSTWFLDDDPSVSGHRALLLSEQGVLIASYPELDAATWIGGDTAAQVAAQAAGQKFYRSSDAAGLTGNAAGPYLQLPAGNNTFFKQYLGDGTGSLDFTVTGSPAILTTERAIAIPYKTIDGSWRVLFSVAVTVASGTRTSFTLTISGFLTKNVAGWNQSVYGSSNSASALMSQQISGVNTNTFTITHASATTANYRIAGDVELNAKPDWADDVVYPQCITY